MTTTTMNNGSQQTTAGFGKLLGQALMGGAAAAVVNLILFFAARAAGVAMTGEFQPGTVSELMIPAVAVASIVPGFIGAGIALAFAKFTKAPARNFGILAAVFTLLSLGGPVGVPQVSTGTVVVMELMHVIAAVGIGGMLVRALRR